MKRVALYVRVSTEEQVRKGLSLAEQQRALQAHAEKNGYVVAGVYEDPGISARKRYTKRPGLMQLLEDAQAHKFDMVLFIKLDRWVRSVRDYYAVQDILDSAGVTWQATEEDYETVTASGRFKVNIMLSVAQDEADRTSERIKFVQSGMRENGMSTNGRAPLGYKIVNHRPVIDTETADAARDMFAAYIRLRSLCALRRYMLSEWGISRTYNNFGRFLSNPMYIGQYHGVDGACDQLVSLEDWRICQDIAKTRGQRCASTEPDRTYLFSGLLYCRECGKSMATSRCKPHGYEYIYYRCRTRMTGGECVHHKRVREDALEGWLLENVLPIAREYNVRISGKKEKRPVNTERIKAKMEKLKDLYLNDLIDREVYARDYTALKEELEKHAEEKPAPAPVDLAALQSAIGLYHLLPLVRKKEFWSRVIRRIEASEDGHFFVDLR